MDHYPNQRCEQTRKQHHGARQARQHLQAAGADRRVYIVEGHSHIDHAQDFRVRCMRMTA